MLSMKWSKTKYELIIIFSLIIVLGGLSRLGLIDFNSSYKIKVLDATSKMPIEGVPVFYSDSVSIPTPGGEVGYDIKQFDLVTNEEGEVTIPFYINYKPIFGYDRRKYVRVNNADISPENNEKNWFYQSIPWVRLPIEEDTMLLERNHEYFNSLSNLMRKNMKYGFCMKQEGDITEIKQIYNPKNEEDLEKIPLYYKLRDITYYRVKYEIGHEEYTCLLFQTDKPLFKISHHLLPAGDRTYYPEIAKYLYIDSIIYEGSETKLKEMNIAVKREDPGFFFFTNDIPEKVSKIENAVQIWNLSGPFEFKFIEEPEESLKKIESIPKKIQGKKIKILKNTIKDINTSPFIIEGEFNMDKTTDVYLDFHITRFEYLTNFEIFLNGLYLGEEADDVEHIILRLNKVYTREGKNTLKIVIKDTFLGGGRYPAFEEHPLTIYKDSGIVSEGLSSASFEVIKN